MLREKSIWYNRNIISFGGFFVVIFIYLFFYLFVISCLSLNPNIGNIYSKYQTLLSFSLVCGVTEGVFFLNKSLRNIISFRGKEDPALIGIMFFVAQMNEKAL